MEASESELCAEEAGMLDQQRAFVRREAGTILAGDGTVADELGMLARILASKSIAPTDTSKLKSLGVVFGDALAEELGLTWIMYEDEAGRDPALSSFGTSIRLFPLDMILKRVEDGEDVDVHELFELVCDEVRELRKKLRKQ